MNENKDAIDESTGVIEHKIEKEEKEEEKYPESNFNLTTTNTNTNNNNNDNNNNNQSPNSNYTSTLTEAPSVSVEFGMEREEAPHPISVKKPTTTTTMITTTNKKKKTKKVVLLTIPDESFLFGWIPKSFPRIYAICFHVILPLCFLICLSVGFGLWLAMYEAPNEIEQNDAIMANRFLHNLDLTTGNATIDYLLDSPTRCFENYLREQYITNTNRTSLLDIIVGVSSLDDNDNNNNDTNNKRQYTVEDLEAATSETLIDILQSLSQCSVEFGGGVAEQASWTKDIISFDLAGADLTFNWNRCWNQTELGRNKPLRPTEEHIRAAAQQEEFYELVWEADQNRLFHEYLKETSVDSNNNRTTEEAIADARRRSIQDATGGAWCKANSAGTTWFWFTVMTTVGYGNQAPVTAEGRWMVSTAGFVSILAFGGILLNAGMIVSVLANDIVERKKLKPTPLRAMLAWAFITTSWIFILAKLTGGWWKDRLGDAFEFSFWDSVWFAYISTTTVGLGDFFLQPQVIFLPDVACFALLFLTGFVFLSAFLDRTKDVFGKYFADPSEELKIHLRRTNMFSSAMVQQALSTDASAVKSLRVLLENSPEGIRDYSIVQEENKLLKKLLERNEEELQMLNDFDEAEDEKKKKKKKNATNTETEPYLVVGGHNNIDIADEEVDTILPMSRSNNNNIVHNHSILGVGKWETASNSTSDNNVHVSFP